MAYIKVIENKKGTTYQVNIRAVGYKPIYKTFSSITKAKKWAKIVEGQIEDGTYKDAVDINIDDSQDKLETIHDLIQYFKIKVAQDRYATPEKYDTMYDWWDNQIGFIKITELSASIISNQKQVLKTEKIQKGKKQTTRKNNTINKYLMCLSAILTYAVKELELIEINPCSKVSLMPKTKGRTRFLSPKEIALFVEGCKNHSLMIYIFFLISLSTGARFNEVRHIRLENIDYDNKQIHYLDTKNKEHRGVHIDTEILELIKQYIKERSIESGYLFLSYRKKNTLADIRGILQDIIKNAGLEDFHIHDIRHTTASYIAMNGGSLLDIAEILGHKSLVMARRYSHLTQKHTASVLNKVTKKILPEI